MSKLKQYNMKIIKELISTAILHRSDLSEHFKDIDNKDVTMWDFKIITYETTLKRALVIFIDGDFSKILKSRYF